MSDDKGKGVEETIADEAKSVAAEAYKDVGRPVLAPIGKTLGTAVEVALAPMDFVLGGLKAGIDKLKSRLRKRIEVIPPERLLPPPATIVAPAAFQYALLGEGDEVRELREMFETLLARSMDLKTRKDAHPAFVTMISQLTPDEARLLRNMHDVEYTLLRVRTSVSPAAWTIVSMFSHGIGIDHDRLDTSVSNLDRLGILRFDPAPEEILGSGQERLDEIVAAIGVPGEGVEIYGVVYLTPLGEQFVDTCVREPRS